MNKALMAAAQSSATKHRTMHWLVHLGAVGLFGISLLDACPFPLPIPGTADLLLLILIARSGNPWLLVGLAVAGAVGIDSLAGPSELMLIAGHDTDPEWAALDLCAQAEHGAESPLIAVAVDSRQ